MLVYAAVPTLFRPDGDLDLGANRRLYGILAAQLDGLLVAGTTGEFPALSDAERLELIEIALDAAGPDRVIAHIGAPDARHTARLARDAVRVGAATLAAITPYYLPASEQELVAHYRTVREAAGRARLFGYLFAERTGLSVPGPLFARVAADASLDGAKISGAAAGSLSAYAAPGLEIFSGDDSNPARSAAAGAAGVISGRAAAYPGLFGVLREAINTSDDTTAAQWQEHLDRVVALGASIGRIKHAVALRGFGTSAARMTVGPPSPEDAAAIADMVQEFT